MAVLTPMTIQGLRNRFLGVYLRNPFVQRCYAKLRSLPILGSVLHKLTRVAVPSGTRVWLPIGSGSGMGLWMHLDSRFEIGYASGKYEPMIEALLLSCLHPGDVFYDIGAHIGLFSLLAARVVGKSGSVFAFEADSDNVERIKEHASRNGLDQIQVIPCAVWSNPGLLSFERVSAGSSRNQGAVTTDASMHNENTIEVEAVSLDSFVREHIPPTLIKIDVEGGEAEVLGGGKETFRLNAPLLICEVHNSGADDYVTKWLSSNSYVFNWIEESTDFPRHLWAKRSH